jgi:hypothetical protein
MFKYLGVWSQNRAMYQPSKMKISHQTTVLGSMFFQILEELIIMSKYILSCRTPCTLCNLK